MTLSSKSFISDKKRWHLLFENFQRNVYMYSVKKSFVVENFEYFNDD